MLDITVSPNTWWVRIPVSWGKSLNKAATVPDGNKLNAASVGANKVNVPGPERTPSSEHVSIAISKVVWSGEVTTIS